MILTEGNARSQEEAAQQFHAAAPGTQRGLIVSHVVVAVSILDDDHLGLGLDDHRLLVVGTRGLVGLDGDCLLDVGLVVAIVVVVH